MKLEYDRIFASAPVNRSAALALSGKGEHFTSKKKLNQHLWEDRPMTVSVPSGVTDRVGKTFGGLTVVGYRRPHPSKRAIWLVRCRCGAYEERNDKTVSRGNEYDRCQLCCEMRHLKRQTFRDAHGRWPTDEEALRRGMR